MISIRDLKFKRGSRLVLDIPSLDIGKGEAVALIGPNGAGKSTLLQVMACLLPVDSGTLRVLGEDVTRAFGSLFTGTGNAAKYIDLPLANYSTLPYDKVLQGGKTVGVSTYTGYSHNERRILSLAMTPSTEAQVPVD